MSPSFERGLGPRHVFPAPGRRPRGGPPRRRGASEPSDPGRAWPVSWRRQAAWPGLAGAGPPSARRKPQQAWGDRAAPRGHRWTGSPIHPSTGVGRLRRRQPGARRAGGLPRQSRQPRSAGAGRGGRELDARTRRAAWGVLGAHRPEAGSRVRERPTGPRCVCATRI